jgi:hypothetical protein
MYFFHDLASGETNKYSKQHCLFYAKIIYEKDPQIKHLNLAVF